MTKIVINGTEYEVPPLTLKSLYSGGMELIKKADEIVESQGSIWDALKPRAELIFMALKQKYVDLAEADVMSALDTKNTTSLWLEVLGISGLGQSDVGEAKPTVEEPLEILPTT